jgi:hypothetical protein
MSSRNEIQDPNLADLPPEAFEPIEGSPTPAQLEARIRIKREGAMQDAGAMVSPHHDPDIEPLDEQPVTEEPPEVVHDDEATDAAVEAPPETQTEEEPEEPVDEEPEEPEEPEDFFVSRYKSRDEAERGIAEKDRTIAQLFRERAEREQQAQQQPEAEQLDTDAWNEWAEQAVAEGSGMQGAIRALQAGGPQGYDIYIAHWMQDEDERSRAEALAFNNEVQRQFAAQQALQAIQPHLDRVDQKTAPSEGDAAKRYVAAKHPDFDDMKEEMDRLITEPDLLDDETKQWLAKIAGEDVEGKIRAWEYLYLTAQATKAPTRARAAKEERTRRKASADAAKVSAAVSSSEGSSVRTPPPEAELAVIRKRNAIRAKAGMPLLPEE